MRSSFAGIGVIALAATPLCAIPLALPSTAAQAQVEQVAKVATSTDLDTGVSPARTLKKR